MDPVFTWLEDSALSEWIRGSESLFAFPGILVLHALGMAGLVGGSVAIDLKILGYAPHVPVKSMQGFLNIIWAGLVLNVVSGLLLMLAYPTKALTNPVFFGKMLLVLIGYISIRMTVREVFTSVSPDGTAVSGRAKLLAAVTLACWVGAIVAGRFLAYTYCRLAVDLPSRC
jgi:hypothetical protein